MKDTSCKLCHFAKYEGITQTGCMLGRIDKFRNHSEVIEAYDHDKEFYVIKDRLCNTYNPFAPISPEEALRISELQYDLFILAKHTVFNQNRADILKTLDSVYNPKGKAILPTKIFVVWDGPENVELRSDILENGVFVQLMKPSTLSEMEYELAKQSKSFFYVPLLAGQELNYENIHEAEIQFNYEVREFVLYRSHGQDVILRSAYMYNPAPRDKVYENFKSIMGDYVLEG